MIQRITENIKFSMLTTNMLNIQREYSDLMEKLSTQKMINRPSDDPVATNTILDSRTALNAINQYNSNITDAQIALSINTSALSSVKKIIAEAVTIAISEAGTGSAETMAISAQRVSAMIDESMTLMNTKNGDSYIFAGSALDTIPYIYNDGPPAAYVYRGNNDQLSVLVGNGNAFAYNITGGEAFGGADVLNALLALRNALETNDADAVNTQIDVLRPLESRVLQAETSAGAKISSLELTSSNHDKLKLELTNMVADVENAQMASLITAFQMKQIAMQASYSMAAKISEMTIMSYI